MSDKDLDKELEKNENEINESQDKDADKKVTEQQSSLKVKTTRKMNMKKFVMYVEDLKAKQVK